MDVQMDIYGLESPNDQIRYLSTSAEQSFEPGCGLKTVTLSIMLNRLRLVYIIADIGKIPSSIFPT